MFRSFFIAGTVTLCAAAAHAQTVYTLSTSSSTYPMSVVLAPNPGRLDAIVSMWNTSQQIPVNVTNPSAAIIGTPASVSQDQYCRAWYSRGRLFTAHRFGGIRMWDATLPNLGGPLPVLTTTPTTYSHEGLETFADSTGNYLFYSEQHTSPTSQGGLRIYQVLAGSLAPLGSVLTTAAAGNGLEIHSKGAYVWQWGDRNNNNLDGILRTYDTTNKSAPVELPRLPFAYTVANADKYLEKNSRDTALIGTLGNDGFATFDVTTPSSPTLGFQFSLPILHVRGVTFFPGTDVGVMWGQINASPPIDFYCYVFLPSAVAGFWISPLTLTPSFQITDMKVDLPVRHYAVGRHRTTLNSELRIW